MMFPLNPPDAASIEALEKAWHRQDLNRYLTRWRTSKIPEVPLAFLNFDVRVCDIGCGIGKFIHSQGPIHPDWGFLGIDKGSVRAGKLQNRLTNLPCPNVFALHANAIPVLASLPPNLLDLLTIFYPNPWWPNKHRQKRWAFHPLLPHLVRLLKPGGMLLIASNEAFYLAEFLYAMTHHPSIEKVQVVYAGPIEETVGRTHFETKFLQQNVPCGELRFRKDP